MKIGFLFTASKSHGGVYQYSISFLEALASNSDNSIVVFMLSRDIPKKLVNRSNIVPIDIYGKNDNLKKTLNGKSVSFKAVISKVIGNILLTTARYSYIFRIPVIARIIERILNKDIVKIINCQNLDLMIFPSPTNICLDINSKYLVSVHDLQHRINPQFPEVSHFGRWLSREYLYKNICKEASGFFVDSKIGKQDLLNYYSVDRKIIHVLPFLPPSYLKYEISKKKTDVILKKYGIDKKYVFYPAKFWPHKNHLNLVKAIDIYQNRFDKKILLVLSGTVEAEFSTYNRVIKFISSHNLTNSVKFIGYLSELELSALYKRATALLMPTYFGPTNIPILEAWKMKTPVIYSNIRGCKEQMGNAGLLIEPNSPSDIANKIYKINHDKVIRGVLSTRGAERLNRWTDDDFKHKVNSVVKEFARI